MSRHPEAVLDAPASSPAGDQPGDQPGDHALAHAAAPAPPESLWGAVRDALRGSERDYTEGPIGRAVLVLSIPMVLEMLMESIFVVCDIFFVARLGADAVATVGLTESLLAIVYTLAMGLSIGVTATVARRSGEHDRDGAARAAVQALALGGLVSVVLGVLGVVWTPELLALMGASPEVIASGSGFTRVMLGGSASIVQLFLVNAVFRGAGDPAVAMRTLWIANGINILLAPCLIFGLGPFPELGVMGAAVATTIGRSTGALIGLSKLFRPGARLAVRREHLALDPSLMLRMVRLSSGGTLQVLIGTASWIGLVRIVATFGSEALAGYTIAIRVVLFAILPAYGLGNAAATLVGQALGAGKPERAERAVWIAARYNLFFLGLIGLLFVIFAEPLVTLFSHDAQVGPYAVDGLRVMASSFIFYAYGMVVSQAFNGAGDTWTPTLLNLCCFWLWEIPLAWLLAMALDMGPHGVFLSVTIAFSTYALLAVVLFRRGRWKLRVV
jgi:putative MATE family efflux protein